MKSIFKNKARQAYLKKTAELNEARAIAEKAQKDEQLHDYLARYLTLKKSRNVLEEKFKRTSIALREMLSQRKRNPKREIKWVFEIQQIEEDIRLTESRLDTIEEILKEMTRK
jgi:hypothetical protein